MKEKEYFSFEEYLNREPAPEAAKAKKTTIGRRPGRNKKFDIVIQRSELEGYPDQYCISLAIHDTDKYIKSFILNRSEARFIIDTLSEAIREDRQ